jgi:hypothetical protein
MEYCRKLCVKMDKEGQAELRLETYLNIQMLDPNNVDIKMLSDSINSIAKPNSKICPGLSIVAWRVSQFQSRESCCYYFQL